MVRVIYYLPNWPSCNVFEFFKRFLHYIIENTLGDGKTSQDFIFIRDYMIFDSSFTITNVPSGLSLTNASNYLLEVE